MDLKLESSLSTSPPKSGQDEKPTGANTSKSLLIERIRRKERAIAPVGGQRGQQFSSFILFLSAIILINLCPFQSELEDMKGRQEVTMGSYLSSRIYSAQVDHVSYMGNVETCLRFVKLMFTNPMKLGSRTTGFIQAEAKMLGKMAKMWYIKKKIKKFGKKLKKHTIAVPVFTAIPIYEHSYYPQPHVTHVTHSGGHHLHHAASSYSPAVAQLVAAAATAQATSASLNPSTVSISQQQAANQVAGLATSASNQQMSAAYAPRMHTGNHNHHHHHHPNPIYAPAHHHPMAAHQIINSYAPSPPLYVDESGGLYGHYGNAYGRYDGGYQLW